MNKRSRQYFRRRRLNPKTALLLATSTSRAFEITNYARLIKYADSLEEKKKLIDEMTERFTADLNSLSNSTTDVSPQKLMEAIMRMDQARLQLMKPLPPKNFIKGGIYSGGI